MSPFEPVGDRARWRIVYDLLQRISVGDVITYEVMAEALSLDSEMDRHVLQMAVRRAAREYEEVDKRALDVIPNKGYRVVEASEHLRLARRQQKRAQLALRRGESKVVNVDMNELEPETRKAFGIVAQAFAMQQEMIRRTDIKQKHLEKAVNAVTRAQERSASEVAELRERLERLERQDPQPPDTQ